MWTVIGKDSQVEDGLGHAFLILSRSDETTMVLQTGTEINELDRGQSGFITDGPTVFCGNIGISILSATIWDFLQNGDWHNSLDRSPPRQLSPQLKKEKNIFNTSII